MVYRFHRSGRSQFDQQHSTTSEYIIPFIEAARSVPPGTRVLEVGCGEGGVLRAFLDRGCEGVGVERSGPRLERARELLAGALEQENTRLVNGDILDLEPEKDLGGRFDLIILKDVIEHIPDQPRLLERLKDCLKPGGAIFFAFPPWQMPFGGHQQVCENAVLSITPWLHLLPNSLYRRALVMGKERRERVEELLALRKTGLSLGKFERLLQRAGYRTIRRKLYLINPIYRYKFGLKPREQFKLIGRLPYLRNFVTTCGYYRAAPGNIRVAS